MDVVNFNAAGIDVGSRSHFVAIGQELEDVKELGSMHKTLPNFVTGWSKKV